MEMGGQGLPVEESLGLNCAWYADILLTLTAKDACEMAAALRGPPATPGGSSIDRVDEHKTGSIEAMPLAGRKNDLAGMIEADGSDAGRARSPESQRQR